MEALQCDDLTPRDFHALCWLFEISVPKQAGNKLCGEPCLFCRERGKNLMMHIFKHVPRTDIQRSQHTSQMAEILLTEDS